MPPDHEKIGVLDAGEPGGTDIPIDLVDEIVAFSKSLRRRLEHKMDATRHRTARGRALFLDVAAQMAAAGPGEGALGPMAAAEPVAEALGAQHVGRRVSVFYGIKRLQHILDTGAEGADGSITNRVTYHQNYAVGREVVDDALVSLQLCPRAYRGPLAAAHYADLDMENCHYLIIVRLQTLP
jgi:hypothetical protein